MSIVKRYILQNNNTQQLDHFSYFIFFQDFHTHSIVYERVAKISDFARYRCGHVMVREPVETLQPAETVRGRWREFGNLATSPEIP